MAENVNTEVVKIDKNENKHINQVAMSKVSIKVCFIKFLLLLS